jgi:trehalose utilization protein
VLGAFQPSLMAATPCSAKARETDEREDRVCFIPIQFPLSEGICSGGYAVAMALV